MKFKIQYCHFLSLDGSFGQCFDGLLLADFNFIFFLCLFLMDFLDSDFRLFMFVILKFSYIQIYGTK